MKHANKQEKNGSYAGKMKSIEILPEEAQMLDLLEKDFKSFIIKCSKN